MKLLIVSTCGTSAFTNRAPQDVRDWFNRIANTRTLAAADADKLAAHAAERGRMLIEADDRTRRQMSAEFAGIGAVIDRLLPNEIQHVLIHTDTAAGEAATLIVADALRGGGHAAQLLTAGGLRTDDLESFREALAEITKRIEEFADWRASGWTIYFNLTGGFKSINGYLQALGMIHADRCVFLFEGSPVLMEIPRLPVRLAETDEARAHIDVFRKLDAGYPVSVNEARDVPESLLLPLGGHVLPSVWGDAVWARAGKTLLAERLLDPLSSKIRIGDRPRREFDDEESKVRIAANAALDALSAQMDGVRGLPNSVAFKSVAGDPLPPSTHELYVTTGPGARRIFGHYEDNLFIVDSLGEHL